MGAPVILCGKTEAIGAGVIAALKPEFDVIHFIMTPEAGTIQIPAILRGDQQIERNSKLGSHDYSAPPVAVILGGAFETKDIEVMMKAAAGIHPVPWLRPDMTVAAPPLGPEYGRAMVARIKKRMAELGEEEDGKEGKIRGEKVVWY